MIHPPASTQVSSILMQDTTTGDAFSVGDGKTHVALFANPFRSGQEEALAINASGRLTHLRRSQDSATAWEQVLVPALPGAVTEVVVAVHPDGGVWALVADATGALTTLLLGADGVWTSVAQNITPGGWSNLHVAYVPGMPPSPIVYGADPGGTILRVLSAQVPLDTQRWYSLTSDDLPRPLGDFCLMFEPSGTAYNFLGSWMLTNSSGTQSDLYELEAHYSEKYQGYGLKVDGGFHWTTDSHDLPLGAFPHPTGWGRIYLRADGSVLLMWRSNFADGGTATLQLGFSAASAWVDGDGMTHIYGIDASGTLSVLHQTGWAFVNRNTPDTVPVWTQAQRPDGSTAPIAVPVRSGVVSAAVDPYPDLVPNLLVKGSGVAARDAYALYLQDVTTTHWSVERIRLPQATKPSVELVDRYVSDVTVLDGYANPLRGHPVTISANTLVEVYTGGTSYLASPRNTVLLATDGLGKITFGIPARGLVSPKITVNAQGLDGGAVVQPAAGVQAFLAGTGTLPSQQRPLTGDILKNATVDGQPLVPSWDKMPTPDQVVTSLKDVFAAAAGQPPAARTVDGHTGERRIVGFAIQTWDPTRPAYRAFVDLAELTAHREALIAHPRYGGWWEDAAKWFSDLWEGIRDVASKVWDIIVHLAQGIAEIALEIGGAIIKFTLAIVTGDFDGAAYVAEALFQQIKAGVDRVVDWLKALFNFTDIWDTKTAFDNMLFQVAPAYITAAVDYFGTKVVGGWFKQQQGAVEAYFDDMVTSLAGRTFGQVRDSGRSAVPGPAGAVTPTLAAAADNPQVKWLSTQVLGSGTAMPALVLGEDFSPMGDIWTQFWDTLIACPAWNSFKQAAEDLGNLITELFNPGDPEGAANVVLADLARFLKDVALGGLQLLDCIVQAALNAVKGVTSAMAGLLNAPIDLGFVNTIYDWFQTQAYPNRTPEPLTLGGLGGLLLAFPVTLMYKLLAGADAQLFPGGSFPTPPPPHFGPTVSVGAGAPAAADAWPPYEFSITMQWVQGLCNCVYAIMDPVSDTLAEKSETAAKIISVSSLIITGPLGMTMWTYPFPVARGHEDYLNGYYCLFGGWLFSVFQSSVDIACAWGKGRLTKNFAGKIGTAVNCITGLGALGTSVAGQVLINKDWGSSAPVRDVGIAAAVLNSLPNATQPIRFFCDPDKTQNPWLVAGYWIKAAVDGLLHLGAGGCTLAPPLVECFSKFRVEPGQVATFERGKEGSYTLKSAGGWGRITWESSDKPEWLTLDSQTGALRGTPPASAPPSAVVNVTAKDEFTPSGERKGTVTIQVT